MLGFESIGNATITCFDGKPLLVTDPWINGDAYFGSWGLSYDIPPEQMEHIRQCEYVWFSHGHPDHMNGDSLPAFSGKKILLPDFVGGRIKKDLTEQGYNVTTLPDGVWYRLSENVEVMCFTDYYQDSILLIRIGDALVIDLNDAVERGWERKVKKIAAGFAAQGKDVYLLRLSGYGDADMINCWDENDRFIEPWAAQKFPVGKSLIPSAKNYSVRYVIPSSSFHCYRRSDSIWAEKYTTPYDSYGEGFDVPGCELLPGFVRVDVRNKKIDRIACQESDRTPRDPKAYGDDWSETLDAEDKRALTSYFTSKQRLADLLGFVTLRVGKQDYTIDLGDRSKRTKAGITFEVPRGSLMTCVKYEIFDDLLIGNFMKTTLHGVDSLYPWFTPAVAKYADNGRAKTKAELRSYFVEYLRRDPKGFLMHHLEANADHVFRRLVPSDSKVFSATKKLYYTLKGIPQ